MGMQFLLCVVKTKVLCAISMDVIFQYHNSSSALNLRETEQAAERNNVYFLSEID
jgi:hypothetical protein